MSRGGRLLPVGPHVLVATSSFESTTTAVILGPDRTAVLVDPGVTPGELDSLVSELADLQLRVVAGISTHPHWDHVLWHPAWRRAPRFLHPDAIQRIRVGLSAMVREAEDAVPGSAVSLADWAGEGPSRIRPLSSGHLPWHGPRVLVLAHDAHAPGHLALVVGEGEQRVILAGDMLSDVEIPLLDLGAADPWGTTGGPWRCSPERPEPPQSPGSSPVTGGPGTTRPPGSRRTRPTSTPWSATRIRPRPPRQRATHD